MLVLLIFHRVKWLRRQYSLCRRENKPSIEVQAESGELESTARPRESNYRRCSAVEKMPTEGELEEFFAAAEKDLQKQFIDK